MNTKLRNKLFVLISGIVLLLLSFTLFYVNVRVSRQVRKKTEEEIKNTQTVYKKLETKNFKELYFFSNSLVEDPSLRKILKTTDEKTVRDYVSYYQGKVGMDLIVVMDKNGKETVSTDKAEQNPRGSSIPAVINDVLDSGEASGDYWYRGGKLYQIIAAPLVEANYINGVIVTGFEINDVQARDLKKITQTEITFLTNKHITATTYTEKNRDQKRNEKALEHLRKFYVRHEKDILKKINNVSSKKTQNRTKNDAIYDAEILNNDYLSFFSPLIGYGGKIIGIYVIQKSLDEALMFLRSIQNALLFGGALALLISLFLSLSLARNITSPIELLEKGMQKVGDGNLDTEVKIDLKDEIGRLTAAFNAMIVGLRQKEALKKYVSRSAWQEVEERHDGTVALGGKRVEVTVLFTDIRNFTTMSERLAPEEVIEMINGYLHLMNDVILRHGGDIDKFIGDAIMAVFYSDEKQDSAKKAVQCAYAMKEELALFNQMRRAKGLDEIATGIGINTGVVVEGNVGTQDRLEHTILGDAVNLASRLEGLSKNSQYHAILLSETTYERAKELVEAEFFDKVIVKGKTIPINVYDVTRLKVSTEQKNDDA